ncbi:MAG TPA: hypothetical protein VKS24_25060 [Bradyrhizobium sp.]|nr:hypothetical protein [Bradyrhizobium sp.]
MNEMLRAAIRGQISSGNAITERQLRAVTYLELMPGLFHRLIEAEQSEQADILQEMRKLSAGLVE